MKTRKIPITAARDIAKTYGYDQVIIFARKVGVDGVEHLTTYGVTKEHCDAAAQISATLQKFMGWSGGVPLKTAGDYLWLSATILLNEIKKHANANLHGTCDSKIKELDETLSIWQQNAVPVVPTMYRMHKWQSRLDGSAFCDKCRQLNSSDLSQDCEVIG